MSVVHDERAGIVTVTSPATGRVLRLAIGYGMDGLAYRESDDDFRSDPQPTVGYRFHGNTDVVTLHTRQLLPDGVVHHQEHGTVLVETLPDVLYDMLDALKREHQEASA